MSFEKLLLGFFSATVLFLSSESFAYLPQPRMILYRTSENHGSGYYQVESLVEISSSQGNKSFRETWWIENDSTMSVLVKGENASGAPFETLISYDGNGKATFSDRVQKETLPTEFFEKFWLSRSIDHLGKLLISKQIAPSSILQRRNPPKNLNEPTYHIEPYLKLARVEGLINWEITTGANPAIWIEQDQFLIRKIRFEEKSEVRAPKFSAYAKGLRYPKTRVVKWGDNQATLTTVSVSSLNAAQFSSKARKTPDASTGFAPLRTFVADPAVLEFYSRFR